MLVDDLEGLMFELCLFICLVQLYTSSKLACQQRNKPLKIRKFLFSFVTSFNFDHFRPKLDEACFDPLAEF